MFDLSRALIVWQETYNAAEAIAQSAEKLSVTPGSTLTSLTGSQMQNAMSAVYAQIPGLNLGNGKGTYTGPYSVTLSSIVYLPPCQTTAGCAAQAPYTLWSSYLTEGGTQLMTVPTPASPLLRPCGSLIPVSQFPNDSTQLSKMLNPTLVTGGSAMTLSPQVVADVRYVFTPLFPLFLGTVTFWASATVPTPVGGSAQAVTFNNTGAAGSAVSCNLPS